MSESAHDHLFAGARLLRVWQAHHAERDEQPGQASEDGYQKRHLKGEVPGLGVDLDDLVLRLLRLIGELFLELGVADHFGVMLQDLRDLLLSPGKHGARLGHAGEANGSAASKMAPANARPNDSPNEPPAEFTPAASLTRSSEIGASV
jgi:hypothetical protein